MSFHLKKIAIFIWFGILGASLFFGPRGLVYGVHIQRENHQIRAQIEELSKQIHELDTMIQHWQQYDFFKEQMARQQLQFARPHDMIYFISQSKHT